MKYRLEEICEFITDGTHQTPEYCEEGGVIFLSSKDVTTRKIDWNNVKYIPESLHEKLCVRLRPKKNDILLAKNGTTGVAALVDKDEIFDVYVSLAVLRPKEIVYPKYLLYAINSPVAKRQFDAELKGVGVPNLHLNVIRKTEVNIENYKEQIRVCKNLDKVATIVDLRKKELEKLDELLNARFVELFGDMILNPNGWKKTLLGEACDVRDGTHDSPKYYAEGYPLVTSKNVTGGKIDFTDCSLICEEDYKKINQRSKVNLGDILMPMIGTVGNPVIVDIDVEFAIKNVALIKFRKQSTVINSFVKALLESNYFDRAVISKVRGGTQKFISLGDIRKLEICLPPINVQEQFADFVNQVNKSKLYKISTLQFPCIPG